MAPWILLFSFYSLLSWCGPASAGTVSDFLSQDPDENRNVSELITSKGYPLEEHIVQTEDGYLLSVQRIPYGKTGSLSRNQNGVVLLIHGLLGDASNWVINFPLQSLGFLLPDSGYDTWLLNTRGCTYSKRHVVYTTNQRQFWNFSFDQVAQYDVPATINYILDATGEKQLYIIGHSQGTTATFGMLSDMPHYNDKVKLFIALAPVATVGHTTSAALILVPFRYEISFVFESLTAGEFLGNDKISKFLRTEICGSFAKSLCEILLFATGGEDKAQINQTRTRVYFASFPSGSSAKSLFHYAQLVKSKRFRKFDYEDHNLEYYHQEEPPDYDLPRITTPVALFWSSNDLLADPEDVDILRKKLNSLVFDYQIPYPYEHFDFVLAKNTFELLNQPILRLLSQY